MFKRDLEIKDGHKSEAYRSKLGTVAHAYNPSTEEVEAGGFGAWGQLGLNSETVWTQIKLKEKKSVCQGTVMEGRVARQKEEDDRDRGMRQNS